MGVAAIVATAGIIATTAFIGSAQDKRDSYTSNANSAIENAEASSLALGASGIVQENEVIPAGNTYTAGVDYEGITIYGSAAGSGEGAMDWVPSEYNTVIINNSSLQTDLNNLGTSIEVTVFLDGVNLGTYTMMNDGWTYIDADWDRWSVIANSLTNFTYIVNSQIIIDSVNDTMALYITS